MRWLGGTGRSPKYIIAIILRTRLDHCPLGVAAAAGYNRQLHVGHPKQRASGFRRGIMTSGSMSYPDQVALLLSEDTASVHRREQHAFDDLLAAVHSRIVLFGAGNLGRKALRCLRSIGVEPLAFADNNSALWGSTADGTAVLAPPEAAKRFGASALFMVTIWSRDHDFRKTREQLCALGCGRVISTSELRWKFAAELLPDYCQDLPRRVYEQKAEVTNAANLWADEPSQQEYLNQLRWRTQGDMGALAAPTAEESYFMNSLYSFQPEEVFVDCGAYDGDTVKQVLRRTDASSRILAVEADPGNFRRLQSWIDTLDQPLRQRISSYQVAVGASHAQLRFKATGEEGACIAEDGDVWVNCVPLDTLVGDRKPTFIKMDIEGCELDALQGARELIRKFHPILSICAYHRQSDLWRIPLYIHSLVSDYKLFLRAHEADGWHLVFYAVPPHRLHLRSL